MIDYQIQCIRCGKKSLVTDPESQEVFCSKCGIVLDDRVSDLRPEPTFAHSTTSKSQTGGKISLTRHDQGLSTIINPSDRDSAGNLLSTSMKSTLKRLRRWDSRSRTNTSNDKNLQHALAELLKLKEKLFLPDAVIEKASYIYRKALEKKLIRGRSIEALVAAALYAACRELEAPRTSKEIAQAIGMKNKEVKSSYRLIFKELELKIPVMDSISCISKIASNADLSEKIKRNAMKILRKAEEQNALAGKHPMGVAASALYLASMDLGGGTTQKEIAYAGGITEVTIRNRCKGLKKIM